MRALLVGAAALAALAGVCAPDIAAAQGLNADGLRPKPGVASQETSPVRRLSKEARAWVAEEEARQTAAPGDMIELAMAIEEEIGPAVLKVAERERLDSRDVVMAVMFEIMDGAATNLKRDIRKLETRGRKRPLNAAEQAALSALTARKALADERMAEVVRNQTIVSRSLVAGR